jgi:mono/diheme cytochrome c family protein
MQISSERRSLRRLAHALLTSGAIAVLIGGVADAQNLNQGKSAPKLFADNCATCHHRTRGLAKGRFSLTLFLFLQKHYTTDASSAWTLTSYLESLDNTRHGAPRTAAAAKPTARALSSSSASSSSAAAAASPRPPASVPGR